MTGSHRAPKPPRSGGIPPWAIATAVVVALIPAAWFGGSKLFAGDNSSAPGANSSTPSSTPIPPVSPSATGTSTQKPSPVVEPTTPANLPTFAPDQPRRLVVDGIVDVGFDNSINSSQGRLEPSSTSEVSRWASRGSPGSPGTDTVVIAGENRSGSASALSGIGAAKIGTKITIRTDRGELTYTISRIKQAPADQVTDNPLISAKVPGRLVLVVVKYAASGDRLKDDTLLVAVLTGAKPA